MEGIIPEDLRCKRSDGKQWRCSALSMPDKTVCEKHYIQAKKRAANSAFRASLKKARKDGMGDDGEIYLESKRGEMSRSREMSPVVKGGRGLFSGGGGGGKVGAVLVGREERGGKEGRTGYGEYSGKGSDSSGGAEGITCHQCRRNDKANVVWCVNCDQKGYCDDCISRWYAEISMEEIQKICPACRGICTCRVCLRGDNLVKIKVQEIASMHKLRYLHSLLSFVLPVLKRIYSEQCVEIGMETRSHGIKADIPRASINADEQMCCNLCRIPIFDYHRHCPQCSFDLCLTCCRDLRRASLVTVKGEAAVEKRTNDMLMLQSADESAIDFAGLFPSWKVATDGSIPCGPDGSTTAGSEEAIGCGSSKLILRRILKINWVAKLLKNAEEMVNGCKVSDLQGVDKCASCEGNTSTQSGGSSEADLFQCSQRDDSADNFLYYPASDDLKRQGISHFHKHWVKGEPIIVKRVFDHSLASSWDPLSIWRGIQETLDERVKVDNLIVKAIDCSNQSEVEIELAQFIKGYEEGIANADGWPKMLKLKDWPSPSTLEEFILCQRPEFLSNLPLVEFIHSKWGLLNLAAKLPHDTMQTESGPMVYISYGTQEELGRGNSVSNLQINMGDVVYLLVHSAESNIQGWQRSKMEKSENISKECHANQSHMNARVPDTELNSDEKAKAPDLNFKEYTKQTEYSSGLDMEDRIGSSPEVISVEKKGLELHSDKESLDVQQKACAGAIWDVFRRQDVPKLNEFLRAHWKELSEYSSLPLNPVTHPVYEQSLYLDKDQKRKLKDEFRIEPWTFEQHVGEAVFVPAGCPFQVRNLQSTVQLGLDFLSPESLRESMRMAQEIRSLPNDHDAKLKMWEVGKMTLYAASWAIREMQKVVLDNSDIQFEDRNLTAMVTENIERITKRRQIACT